MATFCEMLPALCRVPEADPSAIAGLLTPLAGASLAGGTGPVDAVMRSVEAGFVAAPWIFVAGIAALLAWLVSRSWPLAVLAVAGFVAIGMLGAWEPAMRTAALAVLGLLVAVIAGLPLGLVAGASASLRIVLMPVFRALDAIPALAILPLAVLLFGIGPTAALAATVLHALAPVVLSAENALRGADPDAVLASRAFGASGWQRFSRISLPLAGPAVVAGITGAAAKAFSMALIAALIGASGLGRDIVDSILAPDPAKAIVPAVSAALLAIVLALTARSARMTINRMGGAAHV